MTKRSREDTNSCQEIVKLVRTFESLPSMEQDKLLASIVDKCSKKQLSFISNIIMPKLKIDILQNLPKEISLHILAHLPVRSLCRLAQTSKFHRELVDDGYLWKMLCLKYGFDERKTTRYINNNDDANVDFGCPSPPSTLRRRSTSTHEMKEIYKGDLQHKELFKNEYILKNNWQTGNCNHFSLKGPSSAIVTCLQFDMDILAIATDNASFGLIEIFDSNNGSRIRKLMGHEGGVWALEFQGNVLVSGGCDRDLRVWDMSTGFCKHRLRGHTSTIRCLKMVDEKTVVTGSRDNSVRVWDIDKGYCKKVFEGHTGSVRCITSHGNILVSGSYDYSVRVWDMKREKLLHVLQQHHAQIYSVAFNGKYICSGSLDADVRIWDVKTGRCLWTLEGHDTLVGHMQLRSNALVSAGSDGRICVWNIETGQMMHRIQAHINSVTTVQFDENRIISGGDDGIKIWDFATGSLLRSFADDVSGVWKLQFNKTKLVCATQRQEDSFIEIMDFSPPHSPFIIN